MIHDALVGVDVGTTFIKAVVYSGDLAVLGRGTLRTPWTPKASGAEADPDVLARAAIQAISTALADSPEPARVLAIGVTGMGETGVLVDGQGRPVAPAIAWHDRRGRDQAARLHRDLPDFGLHAGRRPTEQCTVVKWMWLRDAGFDLDRARRWLSLAEWVVLRLGGSPESEVSLASRTGALDVRRLEPYGDALDWCGAPPSWLGEPVAAGTPAGEVSNGPPEMRGAVATVAGLDAYASLCAIGADDPRTAFVSCGTSGAAIRVLDHVPTEDTVRAAVEMDVTVDRYLDARRMALLGTTPCGLILQPIYDTVGPPEDAPASGEAEHAAGAQAGEPRHGLDAQRAELWQRSYQAVADGQSRLVRTIEPFGEPLDRVVAAGGWMLQAGLRHALERRLRSALQLHADDATAARGAAMLALDTPLDPITAADATFATDNFKAGELIGQWAKGKLGAEAANAKIALLDLNASEVTVDVLRDQGFLQGFGIDVADINDIGDEKDARIVGNDVTDGSEAGGRTAMENLLQKDPGVNLVYTINEPAAAGAYEALKAAGKDKDVTIVSVDGGCPGVENVKAGVIGATSMQFPLKMASLGVDAVVEFSKSGTKPEPSPGLDFFNTGVELISDQPVDGVTSNDSAFGLENCWG